MKNFLEKFFYVIAVVVSFSLLTLFGCALITTTPQDIEYQRAHEKQVEHDQYVQDHTPELISEVNGIKLYRILDNGHYVYFTIHNTSYENSSRPGLGGTPSGVLGN